MRDRRLDATDSEDIARAYESLLARPDIDASRSGLIGTCVGGAFALMAAAKPAISGRVAFLCAYAPYASMWTLARDIASASRVRDGMREPWQVDPLTRTVYERTLSAFPASADEMPAAVEAAAPIAALLAPLNADEADTALRRLPPALQERLRAMSPLTYIRDLIAPLVVLCHDRDDPVIPVSETRALVAAMPRGISVRYTEFTVFQHLDPTRSKASRLALSVELVRFWRAVYPLFRLTRVAAAA
jgi:pimeloyl-ACP methyl ester carboxylesterase